jgi:hypothetical protein
MAAPLTGEVVVGRSRCGMVWWTTTGKRQQRGLLRDHVKELMCIARRAS